MAKTEAEYADMKIEYKLKGYCCRNCIYGIEMSTFSKNGEEYNCSRTGRIEYTTPDYVCCGYRSGIVN